jgi:uncharacterized protein (DUF58 family)
LPIKELKLNLSPKLKEIKLKARIDVLNKVLEGNWNTLFKGQGVEFAGYRQYTFSDDASKIDWSASLRAHDILVREMEEYRNFNILFLMDVSNSMLFSSTGQLKAEYAAEVTYTLAHALMNSGDAVGLGMFTDKLVVKIAPSMGKSIFYKIVKELSNPMNYGGNCNLPKIMQYVSSFLQERSLIIILSDFIGLKEGWNSYLNILAGKYDIIGIMIRDPRDVTMPDAWAQYLIEDPYSSSKIYIDSKQYSVIYADYVEREEEIIRSSFEKSKQSFISLRTDEEYQELLLKHFRKRMALVK